MPRGSNSEVEQERIRSGEIANTRPAGKQGAGAVHFEKTGYGGGSMQKNPKDMPADKKGI